MLDDSIIVLTKEIAGRHGLPGALACAVIEQESGGNTWAIRYEDAFYRRYIAERLANGQITGVGVTAATEALARAMSWGLMQIMGETAREVPVNYYGPFPALCDPATGIEMGCRLLQHKMDLAADDQSKALGLWNGGANPNYAAQVLTRVAAYRTATV